MFPANVLRHPWSRKGTGSICPADPYNQVHLQRVRNASIVHGGVLTIRFLESCTPNGIMTSIPCWKNTCGAGCIAATIRTRTVSRHLAITLRRWVDSAMLIVRVSVVVQEKRRAHSSMPKKTNKMKLYEVPQTKQIRHTFATALVVFGTSHLKLKEMNNSFNFFFWRLK